MTTADPTAVGGGVLCRVKMAGGSNIYSTRRMTLAEARAVRDEFRGDVEEALVDGAAFASFPSAHHEDGVLVRAERVTAIEIVRVDGSSTYAGGVAQP